MSHRDTELTFKKRRITSQGSMSGVLSWRSARIKELEDALKDIADPERLVSHGDPGVLRQRAREALGIK